MAVETVWDIISFLLSLVDVCINPADFWAWLGLGMDTISILVPFLPAVGVVPSFGVDFDFNF